MAVYLSHAIVVCLKYDAKGARTVTSVFLGEGRFTAEEFAESQARGEMSTINASKAFRDVADDTVPILQEYALNVLRHGPMSKSEWAIEIERYTQAR